MSDKRRVYSWGWVGQIRKGKEVDRRTWTIKEAERERHLVSGFVLTSIQTSSLRKYTRDINLPV